MYAQCVRLQSVTDRLTEQQLQLCKQLLRSTFSTGPVEIRVENTREFYPREIRVIFTPSKFTRECIALKENTREYFC